MAMFLLGSFLCVGAACYGREKIADVAPERIGEFITVSGTTGAFHFPADNHSPYSFYLKDKNDSIRVCAWPEIYEKISNGKRLQTSGTAVILTAEIADYNDALELHVQDWADVKVAAETSATKSAANPPHDPTLKHGS